MKLIIGLIPHSKIFSAIMFFLVVLVSCQGRGQDKEKMVNYYEDGSYEEGNMVEGLKDGEWVSYYDNGNKQRQVKIKNN